MTTIPNNPEHLEAEIMSLQNQEASISVEIEDLKEKIANEDAKQARLRSELLAIDSEIANLKAEQDRLLAENRRLAAASVISDKRVATELSKLGIRLGLETSPEPNNFTGKVAAATGLSIDQIASINPQNTAP